MNYLIDNDTMTVECKHEDGDLLAEYVLSNDLGLAVTLVSEPDDLSLNFTIEELGMLTSTLVSKAPDFDDEDESAEYCFSKLKVNEDDFPDYTKALGKKNLKKGSQDSSDSVKPSNQSKAKAPAKKATSGAKRSRIKLDGSLEITIVDGKSKQGSILSTIVTAVEEEMCSTVDEVVEYITTNHVRGKSGELANESYALTSIRDLTNMGKISLEEGL